VGKIKNDALFYCICLLLHSIRLSYNYSSHLPRPPLQANIGHKNSKPMLLDRFWCKIGLCGIGGSSSNTGAELAGGDNTTARILTTAPNFDFPLITPTLSLEVSTSRSAAAVVTAAHGRRRIWETARHGFHYRHSKMKILERTRVMFLRHIQI
jgi:hypothetical protein